MHRFVAEHDFELLFSILHVISKRSLIVSVRSSITSPMALSFKLSRSLSLSIILKKPKSVKLLSTFRHTSGICGAAKVEITSFFKAIFYFRVPVITFPMTSLCNYCQVGLKSIFDDFVYCWDKCCHCRLRLLPHP